MSIKKCPNCGLPVGGLNVCPACGTRLDEGVDESENQFFYASGNQDKTKKIIEEHKNTLSKIRLSVWDICFIAICNVAVVLMLINGILGGECWCGIPVFALFGGYFFAFAVAAGSLKRFLTRYRNAVLVLNLIAGILFAVYRFCGKNDFDWVNYFVPINILSSCIVMLFLLLGKNIQLKNVMISSVFILGQSILQFLLMLVGISALGTVQRILSSCAFGVNFLTVINLSFLYFIKYRNVISEKFRFWE